VIVSDAVIVIVGRADVGAVVAGAVVGGTVAGGTVAGGTVAGGTVAGGTVVGGTVAGGTVAGGTVAGGTVVGVVSGVGVGVAVVALAVGVADFEVVGVAVLPAAGVVGVVPGVDAPVVGLTTGPTVVFVVGGLIRALRIGGSPVTLPDCFVWPPVALGFELPLGLAWAAAGDSPGSAGAAGQLAALQAMNALDDPDCDALVPYQQISVIAPRTPVPITRFRTECGRW
jgi:hypothetical protein